VLVVVVVLLSGGDDEGASSNPAPSGGGVETPRGGPAPQGDLEALPPGFVECMAEAGYEIKSSADIHSAPPQVLQACFGASH
jgi:hypothetical protein